MLSELEKIIESSPQLVIQQIKEWVEIVIDVDWSYWYGYDP